MKLILFGASGMVGGGVLQQALADPSVSAVLSVGRIASGIQHPKLRELLMADLFNISDVDHALTGVDACIWAVGISSAGMDEPAYARITETLTLAWAEELLRLNPTMSFCYCSAGGAGGKWMWARVRQRVERTIQAMPFKHAGAVRPGFIRPGPGIKSKVWAYQAGIVLLKPLFPLFLPLFPALFTTSERLGRAMLRVVQGKADRFILESKDINALGAAPS